MKIHNTEQRIILFYMPLLLCGLLMWNGSVMAMRAEGDDFEKFVSQAYGKCQKVAKDGFGPKWTDSKGYQHEMGAFGKGGCSACDELGRRLAGLQREKAQKQKAADEKAALELRLLRAQVAQAEAAAGAPKLAAGRGGRRQ